MDRDKQMPLRKKWWLLALTLLLTAVFIVSCGGQEPESAPAEPEDEQEVSEQLEPEEELTRELEIKAIVKSRIDDGDYLNAKLDRIRVNKDYGSEEQDKYIVLVDLIFDIKNTRQTGNEMMRMYSDDLVATLANQGIDDVSEAAVFWEDDYNNRTVKYAYEFMDGAFYIADIAGE